ncbi:MAG: hypothetical protein Q9175_001429 [Cornicularia normoerica]
MVSRKSHPKSRNGCANCKKRRIKCDEVRPRCSNCEKHSISCDFSSHGPKSASTSSPQEHRHRNSDAKSIPSMQGSSTDHSPALLLSQQSLFDGPRSQQSPLQMVELELLHHFTTETCYTLSDRSESHELWRVTVPQVAFQYDFLMRGILAISALHLSFLRPERQTYWGHVAAKQQDSALSSFRKIMTNMDESNCDAFFALSSLIVVYGFESPKNSDSLGMFNYNGQDSDEWLPLIRGVNSIIISVWPWIKNGRLNGLLHDHIQEPPQTELPSVLSEQLTHLENMCDGASGGPEAVNAYKAALESLRASFVRMNNRPTYECEVSIAFLWPVMIPQEFITMLNEKRPEALVLLAHYCVILHHLNDYWWMRGWAMHIINNIHRELDENWLYFIQWPTSVISVDQKVLTNGTLQNPISGNRLCSNFNTAIDSSLNIPNEQLKAEIDR